ncbi:hypothetical protein [Streptococcus lutetiensis]|nr:hypothetical protein [Streptococcus lutetiensis]
MNIFDVIAIILSLTAIAIDIRVLKEDHKRNKAIEVKFDDFKIN